MQHDLKIELSSVKAIVWDWNGTLLDDVRICVNSINEMLLQRGIPQLDEETYRRIFGFPVRKYYEEAGFDFQQEPFDVVAIRFIDLYRRHLHLCNLFPDVVNTLKLISDRKIPQYILSAMEQELLYHSLQEKGISRYFDFISGTSDHYADGKLVAAQRLQTIIAKAPSNILLIGDTMHDHEVAEEMGWQCFLVARGHQSLQRLPLTGRPVIENLALLWKHLNGNL